jgi:hypothetical protein
MARIWNTPIFILATVYFVVDGVFAYVTQPISAWIAKKKPFERARIWMTSLRPYPSLALFAVPVIILEPAKPLAGYLILILSDRGIQAAIRLMADATEEKAVDA